MAKATPASVRATSEKLHRQYQQAYAGRPRHAVPLDPIERLITKSKALVRKAAKLKGNQGKEVAALVAERLKLYQDERAAIAELKYERPELVVLQALRARSGRAIDTFSRHFSGRPRLSRDARLLDALIAKVEVAATGLRALLAKHKSLDVSAALERANVQLQLMRDERQEIDHAWTEASDDDRQRAHAVRAQEQVDRYRVHFAGHDRATCEPERLESIIADLQTLSESVDNAELQASLHEQLALMRAELPLVVEARASRTARDRAGALGASANTLFALYGEHFAGQSRHTRNLNLLGEICDRLSSIRDQLEALAAAGEEAWAPQNLGIVEARLGTYAAEYGEIVKAKQQSQGSDPLADMLQVDPM